MVNSSLGMLALNPFLGSLQVDGQRREGGRVPQGGQSLGPGVADLVVRQVELQRRSSADRCCGAKRQR